ncbi:MAG: penicillin-binding protein 2, partial [Candidatus Cloacimonetes bacterium]|nr:penicillin-binding protein 2 [Candidatus Cloacimonadota bacterium]
DPNLFMQRISTDDWTALNNDPAKPMLDRVIYAAYQPGSVFKPVTGSLGFHKGIIDRNTRFSSCVGGLQVGNRFFRCWHAAGHGSMAFVDAIKHSCNVYFYDLSMRLDLDDFKGWTLKNRLAVQTGIDLPNERRGFFPSVDWYRKTYGRNVSITGHKVNLSIGQGEVMVTPLQICAFYTAIANHGNWIQPHLLKSTFGRGRLSKDQIDPIKRFKLPFSSSTMQLIHEGMFAVSNSPGGTATLVQVQGARVFSKTGSAENPMGKLTHAWYSGFIVTDQPEIVVTVFMENAGGGGSVSAPVANQIFNFFMGNYDVIKAPVTIPPQFRQPEDAADPDPSAPEGGEMTTPPIPGASSDA